MNIFVLRGESQRPALPRSLPLFVVFLCSSWWFPKLFARPGTPLLEGLVAGARCAKTQRGGIEQEHGVRFDSIKSIIGELLPRHMHQRRQRDVSNLRVNFLRAILVGDAYLGVVQERRQVVYVRRPAELGQGKNRILSHLGL